MGVSPIATSIGQICELGDELGFELGSRSGYTYELENLTVEGTGD